ncbi:MAG: hypothetical protein ACYS80_23835 [Planctomycetota bacterium]|jgi:hypothetical protein
MIDSRKLISAVIGGLVVTAAVYADMTPVSRLDTKRWYSPRVCGRSDLHYTNSSSPYIFPGVADPDLRSVQFPPQANADVTQTYEIQHSINLTNGQGSFTLCLYALMGLGLCSSTHWVKKLSFGFIPEWYHNGGPFQIGHSYALTPESLCPVPVCCFVQPVGRAENFLRQLYWGNVAPFLRKSQFTPDAVAPRGPPSNSLLC